jgi:hypothetical protein
MPELVRAVLTRRGVLVLGGLAALSLCLIPIPCHRPPGGRITGQIGLRWLVAVESFLSQVSLPRRKSGPGGVVSGARRAVRLTRLVAGAGQAGRLIWCAGFGSALLVLGALVTALRPAAADPADRHRGCRSGHRRPGPLTFRRHQQTRKEGESAGRAPVLAGGRARVAPQPARKRPVMGKYRVRGGLEPFAYLLGGADPWLDVPGQEAGR